jgi:RIO kinase 1
VSQLDPHPPATITLPAETPKRPLDPETQSSTDALLPEETASASVDLSDAAAPFSVPHWLTDKSLQARARREDERVPSEVYYAALGQFFSDGWIKDVQMLVQSGKEATVYCCEAQPGTGYGLLAAKVYRPAGVRHNRNPQAAYDEASLRRSFESKVKVRTFTWDARYREGRTIGDSRLRRAFERRTRTGIEVQNNTWARSEYETLRRLHTAHADVPKPLAQAGNAVLMEYLGDADEPAPSLQGVQLPKEQAPELFQRVIENIALWLECGLVHADLSSHNLLYWQERIVAIDFPQAVDAFMNPHAFDFLRRDVGNVCKYFARYSVAEGCDDPETLAWSLWEGTWERA